MVRIFIFVFVCLFMGLVVFVMEFVCRIVVVFDYYIWENMV